ncbi:MAG: nuclear transport factor 2 family protein [Candidatus Latescibacterota bacterium]
MDIASHIIALETAALQRWGNGDPSGFLEISAEDVAYFDPFQVRRVDGLSALTTLYESIRGKVKVEAFELLNPRVQASGDVAVLTFNYVSRGASGTTSRWNCTEVYAMRGDSWRIIQTHWSFTAAGEAQPP